MGAASSSDKRGTSQGGQTSTRSRKAKIALFLVPIAAAAVLLLAYALARAFRYDQAFFAPEYQVRYGEIGNLLSDLEQALRTGDRDLLAAVRGIRGTPGAFVANDNLRFSTFLDKQGEYLNYLFYDITNYWRYHEPVRKVDGRYVVAPLDFYYFMDSGRWLEIWGPIATLWWLVLVVANSTSWFYRTMERVRRQLFSPLDLR
jgi:hypothetical protein